MIYPRVEDTGISGVCRANRTALEFYFISNFKHSNGYPIVEALNNIVSSCF